MSSRTFAGRRHERAGAASSGLGFRLIPPPPPGVVVVPIGPFGFDATGTDDISDALSAWLNDNHNVPDGTPGNPTIVWFPRFQQDGVTPAQYRVEGGLNAGMHINNLHDVIFDGLGTTDRGTDGAHIVQKSGVRVSAGKHLIDDFFPITADPTLNPRGIRLGGQSTTNATDSTLTNPSFNFVTWGVITNGGDPNHTKILMLQSAHDQSEQITRFIIETNVGGDPHTIRYEGAPIGNMTVDMILDPAKRWNVTYTPGPGQPINSFFEGSFFSWFDAFDKQSALQRGRTTWIVQQCTRVAWRNFHLTGANPTVYEGTTGYAADLEAQDGFLFLGCVDWEVGHCTVEGYWGNGLETHEYTGGGGFVAPIDGWIHDCTFTNFGRQAMSLIYGGHFTIESSYLGESARSLIDMEPTSARIDPALRATVDTIVFLSCTIGAHGLGTFSFHEGIQYFRGEDLLGVAQVGGIGTSGLAVADYVMFQNNIDSGPNSSERYEFIEGEFLGGTNVKIRGNNQHPVGLHGVFMHVLPNYSNSHGYLKGEVIISAGHKWVSRSGTSGSPNIGNPPTTTTGFWGDRGVAHNVTNYYVDPNNNFGAGVPIDGDQAIPPFDQSTFVDFSVPIFPQYWRDLAYAGLESDEDGILYVDDTGTPYLIGT